ncbi:MAG: TonB-dependent receptor domain-containing protein [Gemmatimonadaceae bacterium]
MHREWFPRFAHRIPPTVIALALAAAGVQGQQTGTISGRVIVEGSGQPLEGAQVYLVGTALGSRTAANGRYTIANVTAAQHRVRAQMIGFRPMEQTATVVAGQTATLDYAMKQQAISLDALVVTGTAGTARNREVGNSISQIDLTTVQPPANVGQLLQGRSAGMTVMPSSAGSGSGSMIRLRGNVSVAMSNQPLVYVDGVRIRSDGYQRNVPPTGSALRSGNDVASPLNDISPNDIERVEVIKGAAASTLYGTEAAAGVIQIFTKRGATGTPQWTVDVTQGYVQALPFGPDPSEAPPSDTITRAYRDSFPDRFAGLPSKGISRAGGSSKYLFIDPWLRNGYTQRYTVALGGGGEALRYYVSGTTTDEEGVLPNDKEQKKVIRGNFSFTPISNLLFSWNTSYTKNAIANTAAGNNAHGLTLNSFRRDRNYASNDRPEIVSLMLNQELTSDVDHLITGGTANWSPSANFTNKFTVGFDLAQIENRNLRPFGFVLAPTGIISNRRNSYQNLTFDYAGSYVRPLVSGMRGTLSWGGQWVTTENRETSAYGENFPGPGKPIVSSAGTTLGFEERQRVINGGFFGQALFDLKDRYFLTIGGRVDGNSAFGENFGLQYYPRASLSWVASDESFWPTWSSAMKFRVAYGQSGRAPGAFDAVRTWEPVGWGGAPAFFPRNVGNPDLGPERTTELEVGFDAGWFNDRLASDFTWYKRDINDALFNVRQIPSVGFLDSQLANVGKMKSQGVEATATLQIVERPKFGFSLGGSVHAYSSEVVSLGGATVFSIGGFGWIMEGQPIPVIRTDFCVTNPDARGVAPIISSDVKDCTFGPNLPTETYGVHTNLRLPYNVTITARGEYNGGHFIFDGAANAATSRSVRWPGCYDFYTLQETGRTSEIKAIDTARCTVSGTRGDYWIYPADFFKLREVSLNVPVPQRLLRGARSASFTLSAINAWKWVNDDFKTFDPETGNNGGFDSRVRSILEHVPPPAAFNAILRVTF